jgi:hypothetical protein
VPPKPSAKIPLSEVAKLEHLIDQEPARAPSEVSKRQAVAMLAPKLYEMRHKGYAWRDVAAWLSGNGLTMTAAALQRHLRGIKDPGVRGRPRGRAKSPCDGKAAPSRSLAPTTPAPAAPSAQPPGGSPPPEPPPIEPKARDLDPPTSASGFGVRAERRTL